MSEEKSITRNEPWRSQAPDYMVAAIDSICDARDDIRAFQAEMVSEKTKLNEREETLNDREQALLKAVGDMTEFANRIYGPDSELSRIHSKLESLDQSSTARSDNLKKWADGEISALRNRVDALERRKTA